MANPEDEKRIVMGLFNRYCIRCHGVDGRGVWDIPGVPDFTNARWQACHSDGQLVRSILEGRGSCMPPFRGTLALDEAWAMSRYLRHVLFRGRKFRGLTLPSHAAARRRRQPGPSARNS